MKHIAILLACCVCLGAGYRISKPMTELEKRADSLAAYAKQNGITLIIYATDAKSDHYVQIESPNWNTVDAGMSELAKRIKDSK